MTLPDTASLRSLAEKCDSALAARDAYRTSAVERREHIERAAEARAAGVVRDGTARPQQRRDREDAGEAQAAAWAFARAAVSDGGEPDLKVVSGVASVTERAYEMWDSFGPYSEVVAADAFDLTLSRSPLVELTLNHNRNGEPPMAHTRNGTLVLSVEKDGDWPGLHYRGEVDTVRPDVMIVTRALARRDLAEASFKFRIDRGIWSPDWTEYRIEQVDLEHGDVSPVNVGASPYPTSQVENGGVGVNNLTLDEVEVLRSLIRSQLIVDIAAGDTAKRAVPIYGDDCRRRTA